LFFETNCTSLSNILVKLVCINRGPKGRVRRVWGAAWSGLKQTIFQLYNYTIRWLWRNFFIPIWPQWCRARKCKHFAALRVRSSI